MNALPYEVISDIAKFRLTEIRGIENGVRLTALAIERAKQEGIRKLLIDISGIDTGPPTVSERHWIIGELALAGRGAVRLAVVMRPEFIDPDDFDASVAIGRGRALQEFASEASALAWPAGRRD